MVENRQALLVFGDDWGRHPSGCQHLIRCLRERHHVTWVNTIGTRRPGLNRATSQRGAEKLSQWLGWHPPPAPPPGNLVVVNPVMWPYVRRPWDRALNRWLLERQLGRVLGALSEPPVAVTKVPVVADLMGRLPVRRWVYYAADDLGAWPGLDGRALGRLQDLALRRADVVLAVSDVLAGMLAQPGRPVQVLTHGVDITFWRAPGPEPAGLAGLPRPLVVYWGTVDARLDLEVLRCLGLTEAVGTVLLVGPEARPVPAAAGLPRVVYWPEVALEQLPALARSAAVLVMPFIRSAATCASQPLKLKEYLATGRPVVACDLPSTRAWQDALDIAASPEEFAAAVVARLRTGLPESQRIARLRLGEESWESKARRFEELALFAERPAPVCV